MPDDALLVGVVARLEPEKGHATLLEAWPAVLAAVPDGVPAHRRRGEPPRGARRAQAAALRRSADRVIFTGRRDDVPAVTAALDVAVLPSYREAQGLSILEAMALSPAGRRLARRRHPRDDRATACPGLLVPPHDAERAGGRDRRALLRDHPLADMLARAGHDLVHDRFCIELMVHAVEAIYDEGARAVRLTEARRRLTGGPIGARPALFHR